MCSLRGACQYLSSHPEEDVKPQKVDRVLVPLFSYFYLLSASMGSWRTFIRKINSIFGEEVLEKK